jgi:hypothetical protein
MEAEEKLVWLGIKTNAAKTNELAADTDHLKETVGDWAAFQDLVQNQTDSYSALQSELETSHGWSSDDAEAFIARLKNEFTTYNDVQSSVGGYESYAELQAAFDSTTTFTADSETESGQPAAGIRIHESSGVSYSGVDVPAGTTEVFGSRIEFSGQDSVRGTQDPVTYANFSSDDADNVVNTGQSITFSADVTNPNGFQVGTEASLQEDGTVLRTTTLSLGANETRTVSFTVTKDEYVCHDYAIGTTGTMTACWKSSNLQ